MPNNEEKYRATKNLNVRNTPSMSDDDNIIGHLEINNTVELIEKSPDLYWFKIKKGNLIGWASHRFLELVVPHSNEEFPWMPIALAEIGVKEVVGGENNSRILTYLSTTTLDISPAERRTEETSWCSAFVNFCVKRAGFEGTDKAAADSWLNWGKKPATPRRGCITVFTRDGGNHVAFYLSETETEVEILGGNQQNAVCIEKRLKRQLLGYRIPR